MRKRAKIIGVSVLLLFLTALMGAYLVLGISHIRKISDEVFQVHNENVLGQIGANVTVFETELGLVLVDSQLAALSGFSLHAIESQSDKKILAVINTHWHPDHSGGNAGLAGDATIIAHTNTRSTLEKDQKGIGLTKPGSVNEFSAIPAASLPKLLVVDEMKIRKFGSLFHAIHYPKAHTSGDLAILAPQQQIAVLGDLVWPGAFPFVDEHNGGTAQGVYDALQSIISITDERYQFLVGHGKPVQHADLVQYAEMIAASIDHVKAAKLDGQSLKAVQAAGLPAGLKIWASPLVPESTWIQMIFNTITE